MNILKLILSVYCILVVTIISCNSEQKHADIHDEDTLKPRKNMQKSLNSNEDVILNIKKQYPFIEREIELPSQKDILRFSYKIQVDSGNCKGSIESRLSLGQFEKVKVIVTKVDSELFFRTGNIKLGPCNYPLNKLNINFN